MNLSLKKLTHFVTPALAVILLSIGNSNAEAVTTIRWNDGIRDFGLTDKIDKDFTFNCPAGSRSDLGSVHGSDIYASGSSICSAGVHAGIITTSGGTITIRIKPGTDIYNGTLQNGISSNSLASASSSFIFIKTAAPPAKPPLPKRLGTQSGSTPTKPESKPDNPVTTAPKPTTTPDPNTCKQGYVWREAMPNDVVCVTPKVRTRTRQENSQASTRREPNGGAYGADTCKQGFVWREATSADRVCVVPKIRAEAAEDNKQAGARRIVP